jgi:hypothetical protein
MAYTSKYRERVFNAKPLLGNKLGRFAISLDFSVLRIAAATGATRQTIYNWFTGSPVAPYYKSAVQVLLSILIKSKTAEEAWRDTCKEFNIKN